ncbi:MAG: hypothetical protein BGO95_02945 [Micrococcales bacterium 73-13]|nr:MAG: hypothetical protein BGO95_02945 [Micrococcales bacterium 73-13]
MDRLEIGGTYNFREAAPGAIRPALLYRSDALHRLTRDGRAALAGLGIRTVVDLRSGLDRRIGGRDRLRGVDARLHRIPIHAGGLDPSTIEIRRVYRAILGEEGAAVGAAIRTIAEADGPIVVHCTAGKDRTGLVVALTLLAVGVDADRVVADYALTERNLAGAWTEGMLRRVRRFRVPMNDRLLEVLAHSPEPVLRETLAWVDAEHGGVPAYLDSVGVGEPVVARLRDRLVRPGG